MTHRDNCVAGKKKEARKRAHPTHSPGGRGTVLEFPSLTWLKMACCVVAGGCTWSKVNTCFLPEVADEVDAAAVVLEPTDEGVEDVASTATLVGEMALMTVR